jgi:ribosomal protein S18 acetylase RimI-like enzyme
MNTDEGPLDKPVWASLTGAHGYLAERNRGAIRYPSDVAPFAALADAADPENWLDLARLFGPGAVAVLPGVLEAPDGWEIVDTVHGAQLVDNSLRTETADEAVRLDRDDVPEILELIARTRPGPFLPRTIELGNYFGIRRDGALIAMAGERLHPAGWTEISAVCTDAAYRGQGLGTRLIRHVGAGIRERGEAAFLHAAMKNTNAIRLYESIGFAHRREIRFLIVRVPPTFAG